MILGAFDIIYLDGHDLRDIGCKARREMLFGIIKPNSRIQFSEAIPGDPKAIFYLADQAGLEGIVSKRAESPYRSGPTSNCSALSGSLARRRSPCWRNPVPENMSARPSSAWVAT
ncbi:hypothetical protein NKH70_31240 [Mesorhizobium sp. M0991]|uniref:ATP-dependent DNA ligase n=1 Tax=unclassified Mesorhizobium TaxID=325217 RepID=UPI00333B3E0D